MSLELLSGTWISYQPQQSMWIGGSNNEVIVVRCDGETLISENTNFSYDEKYNVCNISPSVVLHQLFNDGSIMIKFFVNNSFKYLFLKKRGY